MACCAINFKEAVKSRPKITKAGGFLLQKQQSLHNERASLRVRRWRSRLDHQQQQLPKRPTTGQQIENGEESCKRRKKRERKLNLFVPFQEKEKEKEI